MKKFIIPFLIILTIIILVIINNNREYELVITYCDKKYNCDIDKITTSINKAFEKYEKYEYVKVDKIINEKKVSNKKLKELIKNSSKNEFKYGLKIDNRMTLLPEEINSNLIMDYTNNYFNLINLKDYSTKRKIQLYIEDFDNIKIFETESLYRNKKEDKIVDLKMSSGFNMKDHEDMDVDIIIKNAGNKLVDMIKENGEYVYGYSANTGKELDSYNSLRHAGSTYSLIKYYEYTNDKSLKKVIEKSIDYFLENFIIDYGDSSFVLDDDDDKINLGGNGLALLMLSEYQIAFKDDKYYKNAEKIADGITTFQNEDGSYKHSLNKDLSLNKNYVISYYDGEATFGLLNFYQVSKNKKYYEMAKKSIDVFIENNYTKYKDHWISYSLNRLLRYDSSDKYIKFALDNYRNNTFNDKSRFNPTSLELLTTTLDSYNYLLEHKKNNKIVNEFDKEELEDAIEKNKNILLNYYVDDEKVIYFNNPNITKYGFVSNNNEMIMRIDDIQHSISGLMIYKNNNKN